jgi:3D (Asp-Asp-Asp) domain-containing protein
MIRYLYGTGFLVCCFGLPLKAKESCTSNLVKEKNAQAILSSKNRLSASVASSSNSKDEDDAKSQKSHVEPSERLARLTAYWASEGDYYTRHGISSTGIHLHEGHCAVDPRIIPYGSEVSIEGLGTYLAVDTGSAVISREAAKETGHTSAERSALVIDLYFDSRSEGERFAASGPKFAAISWHSPDTAANVLKKHSSLVADDN